MKICEVCGQAKPNSEFSKSYTHRCKKCVAEKAKANRLFQKAKEGSAKVAEIVLSPFEYVRLLYR